MAGLQRNAVVALANTRATAAPERETYGARAR